VTGWLAACAGGGEQKPAFGLLQRAPYDHLANNFETS
jgi:hypothetical protein